MNEEATDIFTSEYPELFSRLIERDSRRYPGALAEEGEESR